MRQVADLVACGDAEGAKLALPADFTDPVSLEIARRLGMTMIQTTTPWLRAGRPRGSFLVRRLTRCPAWVPRGTPRALAAPNTSLVVAVACPVGLGPAPSWPRHLGGAAWHGNPRYRREGSVPTGKGARALSRSQRRGRCRAVGGCSWAFVSRSWHPKPHRSIARVGWPTGALRRMT